MTERETINDFLAQKRVAVIGVSRNTRKFSYVMFHEFLKRGYDALPVNPNTAEIGSRKCYPRIDAIQPKPDAVLVVTPAKESEEIARQCVEAGIERVWFYRATGNGAVNERAVDLCETRGMRVVSGRCPFMFFPNAGFHRLHGGLLKLIGRYPR